VENTDQTIFEAFKAKALEEMKTEFMATKNPYDRYTREDAYWDCHDAVSLLASAVNEMQVSLAQRLYKRNFYKIAA
jgi:hypothetical protein